MILTAFGAGAVITGRVVGNIAHATEFARMARGTAMSLVAFGFMGGGGVGTAIGGRVITSVGYAHFCAFYGLLLLALLILARIVVSELKP